MTTATDGGRSAQVTTGVAAERRLADLGLRVDQLHDALQAGQVSAGQATSFHPVTAAGTMRWLDTVARLRELLVTESGWRSDDVRNSPRVLHPAGTRALLVARGDRRTGVVGPDPQTARARGRATVQAVAINGQLELPFDLRALADASAERLDDVETWILLHYPTPDQEVRSELSLPVGVDDSGRVHGWRERLCCHRSRSARRSA